MKKILYLSVISVTLLLFSCKKDPSKIVGKWENYKIEFTKFNELAQKIYDKNMSQLNQWKNNLEAMMADTSLPDSVRKIYSMQLSYINNQINLFNLDSLKKEMVSQMIGTFEFKKDSSFALISPFNDTLPGQWAIKKDTLFLKYITFENYSLIEKKIGFFIEKVNGSRLNLIQDLDLDNKNYKMTLKFKKI